MDPEQIHSWLKGPMVAVATPFKEDFSLDLETLKTNVRFMVDGGIRTGQGILLVGGAGGEHPTLNVEERKAVMDAVVEAAGGEAPVLTSIQHTDVRVIIELAKHVSKAGLQGAQLGPTYYYSSTEDDVYRLFQMVAEASDATLMIYHTWWDGLEMSLGLLRKLAEMPTVRALKWSSPNNKAYQEGLKAMAGDLAVIDNSGQPVWSHVLGATGFVTHLAGFWPEYPLRIWGHLQKRDYSAATDTLAMFKWKWMNWRAKVEEVTGGEGPFIKAAMEATGLRVGPPRPPASRLPEYLLSELREMLKEAGVPKVGG